MSKPKGFNAFEKAAKDIQFFVLVSDPEVDSQVDDNREVPGTAEFDQVLAPMREELDELTERVVKLQAFLSGAKPEHISQIQWDLLLTQLHAMRIYQTTLITRCRLFGKNDD